MIIPWSDDDHIIVHLHAGAQRQRSYVDAAYLLLFGYRIHFQQRVFADRYDTLSVLGYDNATDALFVRMEWRLLHQRVDDWRFRQRILHGMFTVSFRIPCHASDMWRFEELFRYLTELHYLDFDGISFVHVGYVVQIDGAFVTQMEKYWKQRSIDTFFISRV